MFQRLTIVKLLHLFYSVCVHTQIGLPFNLIVPGLLSDSVEWLMS